MKKCCFLRYLFLCVKIHLPVPGHTMLFSLVWPECRPVTLQISKVLSNYTSISTNSTGYIVRLDTSSTASPWLRKRLMTHSMLSAASMIYLSKS